jgi:hypothetical protein
MASRRVFPPPPPPPLTPAARKHTTIAYDAAVEPSTALKNNGLLPSNNLHGCPPDNAAVALDLLPVFVFVFFYVCVELTQLSLQRGTPLIVDGKIISPASQHDILEGHRFGKQRSRSICCATIC